MGGGSITGTHPTFLYAWPKTGVYGKCPQIFEVLAINPLTITVRTETGEIVQRLPSFFDGLWTTPGTYGKIVIVDISSI